MKVIDYGDRCNIVVGILIRVFVAAIVLEFCITAFICWKCYADVNSNKVWMNNHAEQFERVRRENDNQQTEFTGGTYHKSR